MSFIALFFIKEHCPVGGHTGQHKGQSKSIWLARQKSFDYYLHPTERNELIQLKAFRNQSEPQEQPDDNDQQFIRKRKIREILNLYHRTSSFMRNGIKCIYSYFFKTHDFLHSILNILTANQHFLKMKLPKFWYSDLLGTVYMFTCQAFVKLVAMQKIVAFL